MYWYQQSVAHIFRDLKTDENGLTDHEAAKRLRRYGGNQLPQPKHLSGARVFISQFASPLVYVLLLAAAATFLLREYTDMIVIVIAVGINVMVGWWQEWRAERSLEQLQSFLVPEAVMVRSGQ